MCVSSPLYFSPLWYGLPGAGQTFSTNSSRHSECHFRVEADWQERERERERICPIQVPARREIRFWPGWIEENDTRKKRERDRKRGRKEREDKVDKEDVIHFQSTTFLPSQAHWFIPSSFLLARYPLSSSSLGGYCFSSWMDGAAKILLYTFLIFLQVARITILLQTDILQINYIQLFPCCTQN